jgi:hypothetical protein
MKHTFTGWKTYVIKQEFVIEADTPEQARALLLEAEENYELEQQWLDYDTNKITVVETPDFYDENDNLVDLETAQ